MTQDSVFENLRGHQIVQTVSSKDTVIQIKQKQILRVAQNDNHPYLPVILSETKDLLLVLNCQKQLQTHSVQDKKRAPPKREHPFEGGKK